MQWFRMYTEVLNDPKAQRLCGDDFKGWVNLLCLAREHDGVLPSVSDIAFALRKTEKQAEKLLEILVAAGLMDRTETGVEPHNWSGRQYKSDVSTDRVKRFRKRSKAVSETPPDTDTDTDTEKDSSTGKPEDVRKPASRKRRKKAREYDPEFLDWYSNYPRPEGKGDAFDAYWAMREGGHDHSVLMAGAVHAAEKYADTEERFIPLPATFLRGERFLDVPDGVNGRGPPENLTVDERIDWWKQHGAGQK